MCEFDSNFVEFIATNIEKVVWSMVESLKVLPRLLDAGIYMVNVTKPGYKLCQYY